MNMNEIPLGLNSNFEEEKKCYMHAYYHEVTPKARILKTSMGRIYQVIKKNTHVLH